MSQDIESFDIEFNRTEEPTELQPEENAEQEPHVEKPAPTADKHTDTEDKTKEQEETKEEYKARTKKQFEKLRLERLQANRERDELRAHLDNQSQNRELTDVEQLDRYIDERAEQRLIERQTKEKIDKTYNDGIKNIPTFKESIDNLQLVGVGDDFMSAILDSGDNSSVIIDFLGQNPEIAEQIKSLSPIQMGRQLAHLEYQIANRNHEEQKEVKVSKVPEPLKTLTSTGSSPKEPSPDDDDLTEWFALQRKKRK